MIVLLTAHVFPGGFRLPVFSACWPKMGAN